MVLLINTNLRGSTIEERVTIDLDHMCLDKQSHHSRDVVEFL